MHKVGMRRGIRWFPRILVTGDSGFVGRNLTPVLKNEFPHADIIEPQGSKFFDLTQSVHVRTMFKNIIDNHGPIHTVIHLAGLSGGIADNIARPASYAYQNSTMLWNIIEQCAVSKVRRLLLFCGGCSYPEDAENPIKEEELFNGFPAKTSSAYSMSKAMSVIAAQAYKEQFGLDTSVIIPTNLIGEFDNCDESQSHVVMGMIARYVGAVKENYSAVTHFGSGEPQRDFLYVGDFVKMIPYIMKDYHEVGPINISTGIGTSMKDLADMIAESCGFKGNTYWDKSKPDGHKIKILSNERLMTFTEENGIAWNPISVKEAVRRTVEWFYRRVWKK